MNAKAAKKFVRRLLGMKSWDDPSFEAAIQRALLEPGDVVYDIGANVGDLSAWLYPQLVGPTGKVFAFEPIPESYAQLCRTCQIAGETGQVVTFPFGLSDETGVRQMGYDPTNSQMASLSADGSSIECQFFTLDTARRMWQLPVPTLVKVDVEGAELFVFRGSQETLLHGPMVFFEAFLPWQRKLGVAMWDVLSLLKELGYRFTFQCPEGLIDHEPSEYLPAPKEYERGYNMLAHLPKHAERVARLGALRPGGRIPPMASAPMLNK